MGENREDQALERIADAAEAFVQLVRKLLFPGARELQIFQINGGEMGAILGIKKGNTGQFTGVPVPAGSSITGVPTWSSDDPNTSLTPSADGSAVAVATAAGDPAASFNLTMKAVSSDGTPLSKTVNVPLTGAGPVPATDLDITQIS